MQVIKDEVDYLAYIAEPEAKTKVRNASSYKDELIQHLLSPEDHKGVFLPWTKTTDKLRLRRNELTLWPGFNGHGKSLVLNQIMLYAMAQGEKALIASMEMTPVRTMERMCKQALGLANPSPTEVKSFADWTDNRLWIYDHQGAVEWKNLLGVMRYCASELGINQFIIDSLMRCGISDDDYAGQKSFVDALCTFRLDYDVHVHLVAHSRKREDEFTPPGKYDLKGSGTITDLADNVITVFRNKAKEKSIQNGKAVSIDEPDVLLICDKQRHHEWEGSIGLWYLKGSMQFVEEDTSKPIRLMDVF